MKGLFPLVFGLGVSWAAADSAYNNPSSTLSVATAIALGGAGIVMILWVFLGEPRWGE